MLNTKYIFKIDTDDIYNYDVVNKLNKPELYKEIEKFIIDVCKEHKMYKIRTGFDISFWTYNYNNYLFVVYLINKKYPGLITPGLLKFNN